MTNVDYTLHAPNKHMKAHKNPTLKTTKTWYKS